MTENLQDNANKDLNEFKNIIDYAKQVVRDVGEIAKGFHGTIGKLSVGVVHM